MKILKFGGASVQDAKGVINVAKILKSEGYKDSFLVISAMGKMTNAFESLILSYIKKDAEFATKLEAIKTFHFAIINDLFPKKHAIIKVIELFFVTISHFFKDNKNTNYDYIYDQVVSYAELMSTKIVSSYLNEVGIKNNWLDARELIHTDANYRNATVDWSATNKSIINLVAKGNLNITQGFIARSSKQTTTTLGREGSDYSAAILAYCLSAESLTIWKDVPGVLNADPRFFTETILLNQISYSEALEMAFYGASVIHPKTIKPLENKSIPLFVRSFVDRLSTGTVIKKDIDIQPFIPLYTYKKNQILLSIATKDFSFMVEHNLSHLFQLFSKYKVSVNLMQNSAISFSVCIEDIYANFNQLFAELSEEYNVTYNTNVILLSIRHFTAESIATVKQKHKILLTQQSRETVQFVMQ